MKKDKLLDDHWMLRMLRMCVRSGALRLLLALVIAAGGLSFAGPQVRADDAAGELYHDFESFAPGPLNGQNGWTNAGPEVTVTDQVYAVSGTRSVRIVDNDPAKAMGAKLTFPAVVRGSVEWWARPETADRLVMLLESADSEGTKPVEWIGFLANGKLEYSDGATRVNSSETYEPGKWYRFIVQFDAAAGNKTIIVMDGEGLLLLRKDTKFRDASASMVNTFRLATISTGLGTYYIDDVHVRDSSIVSPGPLASLSAHPDQLNVQAGQSRPVQLLGHYADGEIRAIEASEVSYMSADPTVATASGGSVTGVAPGSTVITAVYGGAQTGIAVNVFDPNDVPPYVDLPLRPLQLATGLDGLQIVVPEDSGWQALGDRIAGELSSRWNVQAAVVAPEQAKFRDGWSGNVILLGNLGNNVQLARLYGLRMSYADAIYPGKGGYQLQTIVDPFGQGGNTIVVGASDLAGAQLGVDRLLERIGEQTDPVIPYLAETKLSDEAASYLPFDGKPTPENVQSALASAEAQLAKLNPDATSEADAKALLAVFASAKSYGEYYQLTGDPGFGEVYRKLLIGYANFLNRYPTEAKAQLNERSNMWSDGDTFVQNWTVLEASPLFSAHERKQIVSAIYLTYEANARDGYLARAEERAPRWNHEIFPALSLLAGSVYFHNYYQLPQAPEWRRLGERIFTGNTSHISLDEGSDYLMHVPMTNIDYAMASGNLDFMTRSLRPSADLNALMIDNLGTMAGGGDTYPFGYSNAYSWGHSQVMNAATWYFGDPVYRYLLELARTGPFSGQRMTDLNYPIHRYMAVDPDSVPPLPEGEYPRLQAFPVEQGVYDDVQASEQQPLDVALEDTFHKMTFREGFAPDDSYLIVDGFSAGTHGHQDGNAILNYTANGRLFLIDRDYIENTPEHHSGLVIVKDGEQQKKPPLARLDWAAADVGGADLSRSVVSNYNGTDWQRSIVSPNGDFYLIYDDISIKETGDYVLKNMWQTLGTPNVRGDRFEAEQQGVTMTIQSLDASDLRTQDRYGYFRKYWKSEYPYPYAEQATALSEVLEEKRYEAGDRIGFVSVLSSRKAGDPEVQARRLNETTVEVRQGGERWLAVQAPVDTSVFASDGRFHLIGGGSLVAAEASEIRLGSQTIRFGEPVMFELNAGTGAWAAYPLRKDRIQYDEQGDPVREGAIDSGTAVWSRTMQVRLEAALRDPEHPGDWKKPLPDHPEGLQDWQRTYRFSEAVADASWGDLNGDGRDELLIGGVGGKVQAVDDQGRVLWTFAAGGRVNEVTVQPVNGESVVFVATENWTVHALNAQGGLLWSQTFPSDTEHRERKGNLIGITNVRVAHVNGADAEPWIMVGTQFRYIYGLDLAGNIVYQDLLYYYGIEDMEFADFDGDGKEEGVYALEYAYFAYWDDKQITRGGSGGGPGWKVATVLDGRSSRPAFALGTKQNEVRLYTFDGQLREQWKRNVGGEVNDIRYGDFNGDGVPELLAGSDGLQLYALDPDGTVRFRKALAERVVQVDGWRRDGQAHYWASGDNGLLVRLSEAGAIEATTRFAERIAALKAGVAEPKPWVVLANGDVYRYRR
jgi:hypothetical protein